MSILVVLSGAWLGFVAVFPDWRCHAQNQVDGSSPEEVVLLSRILLKIRPGQVPRSEVQRPASTFDWVGQARVEGTGPGHAVGGRQVRIRVRFASSRAVK